MPSYSLSLLGPPELTGPDGPIRLRVVKVQALLYYLAAHAGTAFSRAHLAGLLWEEDSDAGSLRSLSTALWRLRQALPFWPVSAVGDTLSWDLQADFQVDTLAFATLAREEHPRSLAAAVALRRGEFLAGFHVPDNVAWGEWLEQERQRWHVRALDILYRLLAVRAAAGDWPAVLEHARQALSVDPLQERAHRYLMRAYYHIGDRAAALAAYAACQQVLHAELGVAPDPATQGVAAAIMAGRTPDPEPGESAAGGSGLRGEAAGAGAAAPAPLVGREQELAAVERALAGGATEAAHVVLVYGEAGIGKSRLVSEAMDRLESGTILLGHCYESFGGLPFAPITEALQQALAAADLARPAVADLWLAEIARLVPELLQRRPDLRVPPSQSTDQELLRLMQAVGHFLGALPRPVLLVLEDLHWADESTLILLAYLARAKQVPGLTLLVTARAAEGTPALENLFAQLQREERLTRVDLAALSPAAVDAMVTAVTGQQDSALAERLYAEAQGHPLYCVELLRAWRDAGGPPATVGGAVLPPTVQAVIRQRLQRLAAPAQELIAAAAVFPQGAPFALAQGITGLAEGEAERALEDALRSGMLQERAGNGSADGLGSVRIACSHSMVRSALLAGLSQTRLQALHRRAFHGLQQLSGAAPAPAGQPGNPSLAVAEQLAYHAQAAELWAEALTWSQAAATAAEAAFAYATTSRFLEQALACLEKLPPTPERTRLEVDIRVRLGRIGICFHPYRMEKWLEPATAAASALGDSERLQEVLLTQSATFAIKGHLDKGLFLLERFLPVVRATRNRAWLARVQYILGNVHSVRGDYTAALQHFEQALALAQTSGDDRLGRFMGSTIPTVKAAMGDFDAAQAWLTTALPLLQAGLDSGELSWSYATRIVHLRGEWERALEYSAEGIAQARTSGHLFSEYLNTAYRGTALARLGQLREGIEVQLQSIALARQVGTTIVLDRAYAWLAELYVLDRDSQRAAQAVDKGLKVARTLGCRQGLAECHRVQGLIQAAAGESQQARLLLQQALSEFAALGARPDVARCHALLAQTAESPQRRQEHWRQAEAMLRAMGMDWDLAQLHQWAPDAAHLAQSS